MSSSFERNGGRIDRLRAVTSDFTSRRRLFRPSMTPGEKYSMEESGSDTESSGLIYPSGRQSAENTELPVNETDVDLSNGLLPIGAIEVPDVHTDSSLRIAAQVFIPFLIAGFGTVLAGMLLDTVQHWSVFLDVTELFILVPALLGLKGNLEMTLASRLSTAANTGAMDSCDQKKRLIFGNLALTQAQALVVGMLASFAAMVIDWIVDGRFDIRDGLLLCASSLVTASVASGLLGGVMVAVILVSKEFRINPDNVATPIAASLGDLVTLALLSGTSNFIYNNAVKPHHLWIVGVICAIFIFLIPLWVYFARRNPTTKNVLYSGWSPVIAAMIISSGGGLVLDQAVSRFAGIAVYSPVVNGVGGNLVAVQASRISTALHSKGKPGDHVDDSLTNKCSGTFRGKEHGRAARVLLCMAIPGHLIFLCIIYYMKAGHTSLTLYFACGYLLCALVQVSLLLLTANWLVHWIWNRGKDPDNFCIPYLTALGDLLGTGFLALTFLILYQFGDKDSDVGT
ncbi:solute carrier family 41 member 1-like [Corticium candelabrum]|uniref:solute carrier family 41 member 1-like n=1 Tax=Corticium candelabrum TaxID=121492 RepID=UPI002E26BC54|nr:solute carrier family 41 member 1-like [Corticium candelabrum]